MPIYEYKCTECGKEIEVRQKFSDPLKTECAECKGPLEKLMSQSAFVLKGTGWYKTDFADKGAKPSASCETAKADNPACGSCPSAAKSD